MGASPPALVADLVERFERARKVFLSPDYKEEQLRAEFLNPFFESLGWDVSNKPALSEAEGAGLTEVYKPVIHEESIKACPELGRRVAGATKAPDFRDSADGRQLTADGPGKGQ
jgi:hypothetical protein